MAAKKLLMELPEFHFAPVSMTGASLVDTMVESKRMLIRLPDPAMEYNTCMICADELSAFIHKYDDEMVGILTTFYDVTVPYSQARRGKDLRIKIPHPQLNILSGTTPANLLKFMPENAWDQGFTSRIIMVFSDERPMSEDFFASHGSIDSTGLIHDIKVINSITGPFQLTQEYKDAVNNWRKLKLEPCPDHPKLGHYNTRRLAHLFKLSMVAAVDRGNALLLTKEAFNTAMGWLLEAENYMPDIFKAGSSGGDSAAMDDIYHYVLTMGKCPEHKLVDFVSQKIPAHSVLRVIELMERSGQIKSQGIDKATGLRVFSAAPRS